MWGVIGGCRGKVRVRVQRCGSKETSSQRRSLTWRMSYAVKLVMLARFEENYVAVFSVRSHA